MTLTLNLTPDQEARLQEEAERNGLSLEEYALQQLLGSAEKPTAARGRPPLTARELLALSPQERRPYLQAAAEDAASLYEADLALPSSERELTALTALEGEPFHEYE